MNDLMMDVTIGNVADQYSKKIRDDVEAKVNELLDAGAKEIRFGYRVVHRGPHAINGPAVELRVIIHHTDKEADDE